MSQEKGVSESQFYMWRTLFAVAHADNVVSPEEVRFMAEALEDIPFSSEQRAILNADVGRPQKIEDMFKGIKDIKDQAAFFQFARTLVHIDGEYGHAEQAIMLKLQELHLKSANLDDLIGRVNLELEEESENNGASAENNGRPRSFKEAVFSFRQRFLKERF